MKKFLSLICSLLVSCLLFSSCTPPAGASESISSTNLNGNSSISSIVESSESEERSTSIDKDNEDTPSEEIEKKLPQEYSALVDEINAIDNEYPKTCNNLYMIPTGEYNGEATVYNKIVFTNGDFVEPSIEMILEIDRDIEKQYNYIGGLFDEYEKGNYSQRAIRGIVENFSKVADEEVWW